LNNTRGRNFPVPIIDEFYRDSFLKTFGSPKGAKR
jgi:hypothetical protein